MKLGQLVDWLDSIAPPALAETWDNVGLLVGDRSQAATRMMLTIDYTDAVAAEAQEHKCDVILAYHPPIFSALKKVRREGATRLVFDAIRRGVAIYSPHTALDVADGGTNDVLADAVGMTQREPLVVREAQAGYYKLVVYVPVDAADKVADALFAAGAGQIGNYHSCSFRSSGVGTFFGTPGTSPAVGTPGRLETVAETRLEVAVPIRLADRVVAALRAVHPYQEPAFDLNIVAGTSVPRGIGRIGKLPGDATAEMIANLLKRSIGVDRFLVAGDRERMVKTIAVCAGSCGGDMLSAAIARKVDLYITGEMRHHDALRAAAAEMTVICTLHSNSERPTLHKLAERLRAAMPELQCVVSRADADPFSVF